MTALSPAGPLIPDAFAVNPEKARALLERAAFRYVGWPVADRKAAFVGEDLALNPRWTLSAARGISHHRVSTDAAALDNILARLLPQALRAGAITSTIGNAGIGCITDHNACLQWVVYPENGNGFALCTPGREEIRHLGHGVDLPRDTPEGIGTALTILHHAARAASSVVTAYRAAALRVAPRGTGPPGPAVRRDVAMRVDGHGLELS